MANTEMHKYLDATHPSKLKGSLKQARLQHAAFFEFLEESQEDLLKIETSLEKTHQIGDLSRLTFKTPFGHVYVSAAFTLTDNSVGAAILFTDEATVDNRTISRKLHALDLNWNGNWIDSDGNNVANQYGEIDKRCATKAMHIVLSKKFKADSDYVSSFNQVS